MIQVSNLSKIYLLGATPVAALKDVNLSIDTGEFVAIAGPSGCGKSTLLNIIGAIEKPSSGHVQFAGLDLAHLSFNQLADLRAQRLGFVFQTFNLLPVMTVFENVEYPLQLRNVTKADRRKRVLAALENVGLTAFLDHQPAQLSGGQRQRVAIARALVGEPALIVADEPTANLDHTTALEILNLLKDLNRRTHVTLVFATHDAKIIQIADRVVELMDGQIAKDAKCT